MKDYLVEFSRGQAKIQQMAFVLVAIILLFAIASIFYINIRFSGIERNYGLLQEAEAKELARKMAAAPEFTWVEDCPYCVDSDKVLALKNRQSYEEMWDINFLSLEFVERTGSKECTVANYPNCKSLTVINSSILGSPKNTFVALCRQEGVGGTPYRVCELGKIYVGAE